MDVSIVITTYNYADYLEECVGSCLSQVDTNLEYEIIIVDDGSTDQTSVIMNNLSDLKLKKFRIENSGIEKASNYGFNKACGNYIVRVDADDKLSPDYLSGIEPYLNETVDFFYPNYFVIDGEGQVKEEIILPDFDVKEIHQRGDFLATGTLYSAKILSKFNGYLTDTKNSGLENYELILRFLKSGIKGKHIPSSLFCYRRHSLNISVTKQEQIIRYGKLLFSQMGLGAFTTNKFHPYKLIVEN